MVQHFGGGKTPISEKPPIHGAFSNTANLKGKELYKAPLLARGGGGSQMLKQSTNMMAENRIKETKTPDKSKDRSSLKQAAQSILSFERKR